MKSPAPGHDAKLVIINSNDPFFLITMDTIGPIKPKSGQYKYILVICCHFTKWVQLYALVNITASSVAKKLVQFICQHGISLQILTDAATNFQSDLIKELCELFDIHQTKTSPFSTRSDH